MWDDLPRDLRELLRSVSPSKYSELVGHILSCCSSHANLDRFGVGELVRLLKAVLLDEELGSPQPDLTARVFIAKSQLVKAAEKSEIELKTDLSRGIDDYVAFYLPLLIIQILEASLRIKSKDDLAYFLLKTSDFLEATAFVEAIDKLQRAASSFLDTCPRPICMDSDGRVVPEHSERTWGAFSRNIFPVFLAREIQQIDSSALRAFGFHCLLLIKNNIPTISTELEALLASLGSYLGGTTNTIGELKRQCISFWARSAQDGDEKLHASWLVANYDIDMVNALIGWCQESASEAAASSAMYALRILGSCFYVRLLHKVYDIVLGVSSGNC